MSARRSASTSPTGAPRSPTQYRALEPSGGRSCTASSTSRGPRLTDRRLSDAAHHRADRLPVPHPHQDGPRPTAGPAAPDAWVEISVDDATALGINEGDLVRVESARGYIDAPEHGSPTFVQASCSSPSTTDLAIDQGHHGGHSHRAANELTLTVWDPVSKQPIFKVAAVRSRRSQPATARHHRPQRSEHRNQSPAHRSSPPRAARQHWPIPPSPNTEDPERCISATTSQCCTTHSRA